MTPSAEAGRQVGNDASDTSIFATPGHTVPTSDDRLTAELVEIRAELREQMSSQTEDISAGINAQNEKFRAQIFAQNEKFEQKFETMFQAFMEHSNTTKDTVSVVVGRVKSIE